MLQDFFLGRFVAQSLSNNNAVIGCDEGIEFGQRMGEVYSAGVWEILTMIALTAVNHESIRPR
jgi:hypothetical protein